MNHSEYEQNLYLAHHGIKGQKWGIRRYQNYDGSLTQAGVKRYERAVENYNKAKSDYDRAKSEGDMVRASKAKNAMDVYRRDANTQYKNLKKDKKADQGKSLRADGKTISGEKWKAGVGTFAVGLVAATGIKHLNSYPIWSSNVNATRNAQLAIAGAAIASNLAINSVAYSRAGKMASYDAHSHKNNAKDYESMYKNK